MLACTQKRLSSTQSTPKVTPQDKSFTIPLTGRWGNQLTSRPGLFHVPWVSLTSRHPCLMGAGQPRRKLLWQKRGVCAPWGHHWVEAVQGQTAMASLCLYSKNCVSQGRRLGELWQKIKKSSKKLITLWRPIWLLTEWTRKALRERRFPLSSSFTYIVTLTCSIAYRHVVIHGFMTL